MTKAPTPSERRWRSRRPDEPALRPAGSSVARRALSRVPPSTGAVDTPDVDDGVYRRLSEHLRVARELGIEPLTVAERAASLLAGACPGWRRARRCSDAAGRPTPEPHPGCLQAQYQHDVLLLEHGLLDRPRHPTKAPNR